MYYGYYYQVCIIIGLVCKIRSLFWVIILRVIQYNIYIYNTLIYNNIISINDLQLVSIYVRYACMFG